MNTIDKDPATQEQYYKEWLAAFKNSVDDPGHKQEWENMSVQRCFLKKDGEPYSFDFTVESVGIRPVKDIVAEGIRAVVDLVTPYASADKSMVELGLTAQPSDSRMNGIDILFDGQEHTLGNLLQTLITELYLDSGSTAVGDAPITFVGYKVRHPLHRVMTLRFGFAKEGDSEQKIAIARQLIAAAAAKAVSVFNALSSGWAAVGGSGSSGSSEGVAPELEG